MHNLHVRLFVLFAAALILVSGAAFAQGQDSTPGERYVRIMAEMLPGTYDNANQHYFDRRRDLEGKNRHARANVRVARIEAPALGDYVFTWTTSLDKEDGARIRVHFVSLSADGPDDVVAMRFHHLPGMAVAPLDFKDLDPSDLRSDEACEYHFRRRADSFRGIQKAKRCKAVSQNPGPAPAPTIELSKHDLYVSEQAVAALSGDSSAGVFSGEPYWLERARVFQCYADLPGVGGGRDEPFERYDGIKLHDKGGRHGFTTRDAQKREISLLLQSVTWQLLNENNGNFNRNSLVIYVTEKLSDGTTRDHGYAFTAPSAERIGVNLKWMLVNCSVVPPSAARPEM